MVLFAPGHGEGGTTNLLLNLARYWQDPDIQVVVADVEGGFVSRSLAALGAEFEFRPYRRGGSVEVRRGETLVAPILPARNIGTSILMHDDAKLVLWVTHPQDGFKWLPFYHPARTWSDENKRRYARLVHPSYWNRLRSCFNEGVTRGGLVCMDQPSARAMAVQFGLDAPPPVVPIFTAAGLGVARQKPSRGLRLTWVGRICDFKTQPIIALIREVAELRRGGTDLSLTLVGDGEDRAQIQAEIDRAGADHISIRGQLDMEELNKLLAEETDICCGHGTSILEGAKFGIPCLLIDGFYFEAQPEARKLEWLSALPPADVGFLADRPDQLRGRRLSENLSGETDLEAIGAACLERWRRWHSPEAAVETFARLVRNCTWLARDLKRCGFDRYGLVGSMLMAARHRHTRGKY